MQPQCLKGQTALVTGANSGIGEAIAKALAVEGASVVINYVVAPEKAQKVVSEIQSKGGKAIAVKADISNEDQVKAMFKEMIETYGTIHILVNNAGVQRDAPFHEMTLKDWEFVLSVNLTGQFLCAREAVCEFLRRGIMPEVSCARGKIICMSSVHENIPWAMHANYAASKGGVMLLMRSMAQELAPQKIRINSICPGAIRTPINVNAWSSQEAEAELLSLIPYGRVGEPEDIGRVAVWLASDESDYVNGVSIFVDGGMMLYPGFATGG
ncbi:MAG: SDR family oxidoreductase [bacterium]